MLFNNSHTYTRKKKRVVHLHYGTPSKARQTIRYLRRQSRAKQIRGAQTMYFRAKYHARQTPEMRESMKLYSDFLKTIKQ
jgi:hypothetical protein